MRQGRSKACGPRTSAPPSSVAVVAVDQYTNRECVHNAWLSVLVPQGGLSLGWFKTLYRIMHPVLQCGLHVPVRNCFVPVRNQQRRAGFAKTLLQIHSTEDRRLAY